jgi:ribose-phosphate pyrophosphokinase
MVMVRKRELKIFSGNSNLGLAREICRKMDIPLGNAVVGRFSDGEINVQIMDNVRGMDVFVVQPTASPVNRHLMELLIMIDALKRASATRITAVLPYYGYSRQDRKVQPRVPITSKLVADLITSAGANRVLTVDLHAGQIQGFFNIPVDNLFASPVLLDYPGKTFKNLRSFARCRRRGAGQGLCQAARRFPGDHRQAARQAERGAGHEHYRRRERA